MADLSNLLAELGGDNPQNRAIAEGLQKQGIASTNDIGVRKVPVPGHFEGTDEASHYVPETTENAYFNKADGKEINPTRLGVYQVDKNGKAQGDIFFHLNADDKGNVTFQPQWSPRAHGYLRDNAVGQAIMSIGKIIPVTSPYFLAASAADAAAHGKYGVAIANLVPLGLQQLTTGTDVLTKLAGPDFNPVSVTPGGQIAEALGVPVQVADQVGKAATSAVKAGLSGQDAGDAVLKSGVASLVGSGLDYLKGAGSEILKDIKGGISNLMSPDTKDFASVGQNGLPSGYTPNEDGTSEAAAGYRKDENGNLINIKNEEFANNPFKAVDDSGIAGLDKNFVAYDDEGNLMPGYELDENNNPVKVDEPEYKLDGAGKDYVSPPSGDGVDGTMVDDAGSVSTVDENGIPYKPSEIDTTEPLQLPPGAEPDEEKPPEPYLLNPEETGTTEKGDPTKLLSLLPLVPAIFPPKPKTPTLTPVTPKGPDDTGLGGITSTLLGGTSVGGASTDPLTGKYTFSWNKQPTKGPEKGIAYGQKYYGQHWNVSHPVDQSVKQPVEQHVEQPVDQPVKQPIDQPVKQPVKQEEIVEMPIQYAEGGLMALDKTIESPTFRPTMGDGGIHAEDLKKQDVANQALQHMRRGGHLIDHKTHKDVHYLASKGEPVHHIVGFMNHRKRMAEGGITSHSLGSYSDGGHLLKGPGDGMSDDIPATIAGKQPARLANEEFVIPADVVSHLGNGSSESGAKVLYEMMSRIRKARTGNPKQGKQIDPHKLLPKV